MSGSWGPTDPGLWLTRALGHWEAQLMVDWPPGVPGPSRCSINNVTFLRTGASELDLDLWETGLRQIVCREPALRTGVDLAKEPVCWRPARDFSGVFSFTDLREKGCESLEDVWDLVEEEANRPWDYTCDQPLFRSVLLRLVGGYVIMNVYHHAAGDGTTGMIVTRSLLDNYDILRSGGQLEASVNQPLPCIEDLTMKVKDDNVLKTLIANKVDRAKHYKPFTPFHLEEMRSSQAESLPLNLTLIREGSRENLAAMRARCRQEGVSLNSLALAASQLAMAAVQAEHSGQELDTWPGLRGQLIDVPVNMRHRLDPAMANRHAGFLITEITTKCDVLADTGLWVLARDISRQCGAMLEQRQHFVFSEAKIKFETGETRYLAASTALEDVGDVLVSNMMGLPGRLDFPWAEVVSVHCVGSYWAPGFSNYLLLFQSTKHMNYDVCYCKGEKNRAVAEKLLRYFTDIMETSHKLEESYCVRNLLTK